MPTAATDKTKKVRRKINPATCTPEELLSHLAVDPAQGLSHSEAAKRRTHSTATPLYCTTALPYSAHLKRVLREPALWMLLAVAVMSMFFNRIFLGIVCFILAGGHAALCAYLSWRAHRVDAAMQTYDAPLCRVRRGSRLYRVDANHLVRGDILYLHPGDMIPADCRLLYTEGFVVSEREIDASADRPSQRLNKDAKATPDTTGNFRLSPINMVFAGGVVEAGVAIAVVVAVGSNTHLGGLVSRIVPGHAGRAPRLLKKSGRVLSVYSICTFCLIIPLIAIGIFTLGSRYEFLDIFLSALCLVTLTLTEHLLAKGYYLFAAIRRDAATDRDYANSVDIKTSADLETLLTVTDLILVGGAALHDGDCHPETLYTGGMTYHCDEPEADDAARHMAELLCLYRYATREQGICPVRSTMDKDLAADLDRLTPALSQWAELDTDALLVRWKDLRAEERGVSAVIPTVEGNSRITVRLTNDFEELKHCDEIFTAGRLRITRLTADGTPPDPSVRPSSGDERFGELSHAYGAALKSGLKVAFLITQADGKSTIRAMLTYAPHVSLKTAGIVRSMENAGIRVVACKKDISQTNRRILTQSGLLEEGTTAYCPGDGSHTSLSRLLDDGVRALEGCTQTFIMDGIRDLQDNGRTVAVLSVEHDDLPLLGAADVAVTCAPSLYHAAEEGEIRIPTSDLPAGMGDTPDGTENAHMATDLCRRRADLVVRRATATGGGIAGVRRALLAADHAKNTLDRVFAFLFLSQAIRLVATVLPLCLGLSLAAAPALLVSGLVADLIVLLIMNHLPEGEAPAPRRSMTQGLLRPWLTYRGRLIAVGVATGLPWLVLFVIKLVGLPVGTEFAYFGALCLFGLQVVLFRAPDLPRKNRTVFLTTLALVLLYVGALAAALGGGLHPLVALFVPPVVAALGFLLLRILRRFDVQA